MDLAVTGTKYNIMPVADIREAIDYMDNFFNLKKPHGLAFTYSINKNIVKKLANVCTALRIFAGIGNIEEMHGVTITVTKNHYKGIVVWDDEKTINYIGSSNLVPDIGINYGLLITCDRPIEGFDTSYNTKNYKSFHDPILVIYNEIVTKETNSRCEICGSLANVLYLNKYAKLVCEECR